MVNIWPASVEGTRGVTLNQPSPRRLIWLINSQPLPAPAPLAKTLRETTDSPYGAGPQLVFTALFPWWKRRIISFHLGITKPAKLLRRFPSIYTVTERLVFRCKVCGVSIKCKSCVSEHMKVCRKECNDVIDVILSLLIPKGWEFTPLW